MDLQNLSVLSLDVLQQRDVVPVSALGHHHVRGKDLHSVDLWVAVLLRGLLAPDDLVLLDL